MWSLFGKIMSYDYPEKFSELVTKTQYTDLLKKLVSNFKIRGIKNSYLGDGVFAIKYNNYKGQFVMDNLIRTVIQQKQGEWENEISKLLDKLYINEDNLEIIYKKFDYARPLLRVLVKPDSFDLWSLFNYAVLWTPSKLPTPNNFNNYRKRPHKATS
jgi:hypothetical protein